MHEWETYKYINKSWGITGHTVGCSLLVAIVIAMVVGWTVDNQPTFIMDIYDDQHRIMESSYVRDLKQCIYLGQGYIEAGYTVNCIPRGEE